MVRGQLVRQAADRTDPAPRMAEDVRARRPLRRCDPNLRGAQGVGRRGGSARRSGRRLLRYRRHRRARHPARRRDRIRAHVDRRRLPGWIDHPRRDHDHQRGDLGGGPPLLGLQVVATRAGSLTVVRRPLLVRRPAGLQRRVLDDERHRVDRTRIHSPGSGGMRAGWTTTRSCAWPTTRPRSWSRSRIAAG